MNTTNLTTAQIIQEIKRAAQIYHTQLSGRTFLYVFDHRYIEVMFKAVNFRHLTGVESVLPARAFYYNALHNRLYRSQISFSSAHPFALCQRKVQHICDIATLMSSECIILENIQTATRTFRFGATDLTFTICLEQSLNAQGMPEGDLYVAASLRDEDCFARSSDVYSVDYIFSKPTHAREYDTLHFRDTSATRDDMPETVMAMLSQEISDLVNDDP